MITRFLRRSKLKCRESHVKNRQAGCETARLSVHKARLPFNSRGIARLASQCPLLLPMIEPDEVLPTAS